MIYTALQTLQRVFIVHPGRPGAYRTRLPHLRVNISIESYGKVAGKMAFRNSPSVVHRMPPGTYKLFSYSNNDNKLYEII